MSRKRNEVAGVSGKYQKKKAEGMSNTKEQRQKQACCILGIKMMPVDWHKVSQGVAGEPGTTCEGLFLFMRWKSIERF